MKRQFLRQAKQLNVEALESRSLLSTVSLVADINQTTVSSESTSIVEAAGKYFFKAVNDQDASQLYLFDPATEQSNLFKDLHSLPKAHGERCDQIVTVGDGVFFFAVAANLDPFSAVKPKQLWFSDGTVDGTQPIMDVEPASDRSCGETLMQAAGDEVFFQISFGDHRGLWRSDGTTEGTVEVVGTRFDHPLPRLPVRVGDRDVFLSPDKNAKDGRLQLLSTDVSASDTAVIAEQPSSHLPSWSRSEFFVADDMLYFAGQTESQGVELWVSDGTAAGTQLFDIVAGPGGSNPSSFHRMSDGTVLFSALTVDFGRELWRTDGTEAGTRMVKDIFVATDGSNPENFWQFEGATYFEAGTIKNGREMWRTDGTEAGTMLVKDIEPGLPSGGFVALGNVRAAGRTEILFGAGINGALQLWRSDGTTEGTTQLMSPTGGGSTGQFDNVVDFKDGFAFVTRRNELWFTDGKIQNLVFGNVDNSKPDNLQVINGKLYFTATTDEFGNERYVTDGTAEGTRLVEDLNQRPGESSVRLLGQLDNGMYIVQSGQLFAIDPLSGTSTKLTELELDPAIESFQILGDRLFFHTFTEIWVTDGTTRGTALVKDFHPIRFEPKQNLYTIGDQVYFRLRGQLWRTDGTPEGTHFVTRLRTMEHINGVAGKVFFTASADQFGEELWATDGTTEGSYLVKDIRPGPRDAGIKSPTVFKDRLYFLADGNGDSQSELWTTDGTADGTVPLLVEDVRNIFMGSDVLYFGVRDSKYGSMLWRTDGTDEGSYSLGVPNVHNFVEVNGSVFFLANDKTITPELQLWRTDGTVAGTVEVKGVLPSHYVGYQLVEYNSKFLILDRDHRELYESDGTQHGTQQLTVDGYTVLHFGLNFDSRADGIYFTPYAVETGAELFRIHPNVESHPTVTHFSIDSSISEPQRINSVSFTFDSDVGQSLQTSDLKITSEVQSGMAVDTAMATMTWDADTKSATWDLARVELEYGFYTVELSGQGVFDQHNNNLDGNGDGINGDSFRRALPNALNGDVDLNGKVDFADFLILSANFGKTSSKWTAGDLNSDRSVDFADFLVLAMSLNRGRD